ncbi:MAG: hypothetical protein A2504_16045 [Bdellovibrionales bacterium RIFOXYD12_FULL_39_22]|nr:MAG: hypothetical protein A2385_07955 [Bdellovibrionales bacterium RIFOXYB1_FULL_39_21]OFZ43007.1 MAG: hypothetical protein A2485_11270 [Bdellovibrionales bacterium RIFOXYC12_FULL_39_17]OFZ50907.1 MAG: hypothetical protein A2404_06870 [Bdellovibrionales bacterium RIFOXYC1_FULL_39_130]OFZ73642.1 MAG: hypothetical protein A2451_06405 [Bdellovibrionales bacterium RIFOXYC2_FULL_39_8]OFZ78130.1 MAG: hypothetical protein A2560_02040 [Bdellovibrionales bacterium RIFOXYD1_FULL_39_84]OFZ93998.1 MAG:
MQEEIECTLPPEIKYQLYETSVQCHSADILFINREFKQAYDKAPLSLREDFCGTAIMACDWVCQSQEHLAFAIDIDKCPLEYGLSHHYPKLSSAQQSRMNYVLGNVLDNYSFKTDVVVAFNFSYFVFKKRKELLDYFKKVRKSLNEQGAFFIDLFGGTEAFAPLEEETEHDGHSYYWDCEGYNPLTAECQYYIHFKTHHDGIKHKNAFSYSWRMWTVAELCEILEDAGFSKTITFWEGEDGKGSGDGVFYNTKQAENCESWVTYILALN